MGKFVLDNGLDVVYDRRPSDSVAVEISVRAGSNNERKGVEGISHFLEHMFFEGTRRRRDSRAIANEIERLGGELNAATSNERTFFYAKVPSRHFEVALDVLGDILQDSVFPTKGIENNRKVIINEINMVNDEPLYYQWVLFYGELFKGTPVGEPVYGRVESVSNMRRRDLLEFRRRNYSPDNLVLGISGGVSEKSVRKAWKYFTFEGSGPVNELSVPVENESARVIEKRKINQSYMVLGYRTVPRNHGDSFVLDVIKAVLGRGQSGWMFDEIRNKRALAYNVGVEHTPELDYGIFAVSVGTRKKNVGKVERIICDNFRRLQRLTPTQLEEAK
ncbi:MAG: pitrilysin family protein, partial [Candidatus Altiarchaeota archaeon]|nr:pitrilysin family protein [Candidatus Altiarchaeota archaeon]